MTFMMEKDVEELLETEVRILTMPDGTPYPYRGFKIMWNSLDYMIGDYGLTLEWFIALSLTHAKESGRDFDTAFRNIVAYVREKGKEKFS